MQVRFYFVLGGAFLCINSPCFAVEDRVAVAPEERTQIMPTLNCFKKLAELRPWFEQIKQKITDAQKNQNALKELSDALNKNAKLSLELGLKLDGSIDSLSILRPSGSDTVDKEALEIVQQTGPFPEPPNDLPNRGVMLELLFEKIDGTVKLKTYPILPPDFVKTR